MLSSTARRDRSSLRGSVGEVPRIVPPSARIRAASRGRSGRGAASPRRPAQPSAMPKTSCPRELARSTTARMAAFRPGASPPPVRTPIRTVTREVPAGCALALGLAFLPLDGPVELLGRDRFRRRIGLELAAYVEAGRAAILAEHDVEEHRVRGVAPGEVERLFRRGRLRDGPALRGQSDPDHIADETMIVGDQDVSHAPQPRPRA